MLQKILILLAIPIGLAVLVGFIVYEQGDEMSSSTPAVAQTTSSLPDTSSLDDQSYAESDTICCLKPTMLELGSKGCKPCDAMQPVMAELEKDYGDKIKIVFHDVRKNPDVAKQHGIRLIPTQIFLDADGNEFYRHEGFFARDSIETVFRSHGVVL